DLLCFFFAFLSLNIFIKYTQEGKPLQLIVGAVYFFLAFLAKETVITFLAIVPLIFFLYKNEHKRRSVYITGAVVLAALVAILTRFQVLHTDQALGAPVGFIDNPLAGHDISLSTRIATAILILGSYIKLLFIPYPLICDYAYNSIPFVDFGNIKVLLSLSAYIALAIVSIWRLTKDRKDLYAFCILFFLITIALFSNIFFLIGDNMAERFLFFPSLSFCIVAALFIGKLLPAEPASVLADMKQPKIAAVLISLSLIYSTLTIARNNTWKDNLTLFSTDSEKAPDDSRLLFFLGNELSFESNNNNRNPAERQQMLKDAIADLEKAIAIYPDYAEAHQELGKAYLSANAMELAEKHEKIALQLSPNSIDAANYLAAIYLTTKRYAEGIRICNDVLRRAPLNATTHFNLGGCYANTGNYSLALTEYKKVIAIDPHAENYRSFDCVAALYNILGKADSAKGYESLKMQYSRH
ncbi:MAG: Tetratricopeptide 2 repeat-containing protein, partial [Flavipsychrobacter sp.]|nr:Tetratricopeptide 2 repeat-containing protein [Flavipsychrobacter sp.]